MHRHHRIAIAGAAVALLVAVVAIVGAAAHWWVADVVPGLQADVPAQQHLAEAAVAAPNPACAPPAGAGSMGVCAQNRGTLALTRAIAPQGDRVPTNGNRPSAGLASVIFGTARAASQVDRGEDVSAYQTCSIDWRQRARYLSYAHAKDDEGAGYHDRCVAHNVASALAAHLPIGTYEFDRTNVSPILQARRQAADDKAAGADPTRPGILPSTIDAETNDGGLSAPAACAHVSAYIVEYERLTRRYEMELYSSIGTWPGGGCPLLPPRTIVWDAAYGPSWNNVAGRAPCEWQYSDGVYGPTPRLDGGDSDIWICPHAQLVALAHAVPPIPPPTSAQWSECGQLRYLRSHAQGGSAEAGDVRNSLVANRVACPDHRAVRTSRPRVPQPSPDEFRMCRLLLGWRAAGRPAVVRARELRDRAQLVRAGIRCSGAPPLIAVR